MKEGKNEERQWIGVEEKEKSMAMKRLKTEQETGERTPRQG